MTFEFVIKMIYIKLENKKRVDHQNVVAIKVDALCLGNYNQRG